MQIAVECLIEGEAGINGGEGGSENSSKFNKRGVLEQTGGWKILENLIAVVGGENFLWYDKIEYKDAEEFWVAITL